MSGKNCRVQPVDRAEMIRSRLVLNFPGFEPTGPGHQLGRIERTADKTGVLWNFELKWDDAQYPDGNYAIAHANAKGHDWRTQNRIVQFSWNDIIDAYESVEFPKGLISNFPKYLAFFADGTANKYWRASKRYWGFTIWPILQIAVFAVIAVFASRQITNWLGFEGALAGVAAIVITAGLTLLLCKWPGERSHMLLAINDWGFARDMVHRTNPVIEARYREFGHVLRQEIESGSHDEIVISGHSFGSLWAVAALATALEDNPDLLKSKNISFLAMGSSLLKIALAPDAQFMREWTQKVWSEPSLFWHEVQTKDDIIAFYKSDPRIELGQESIDATMAIDRVNYKKAMERKRYNKTRMSFFRMHRQYILNQDRKVAFDYLIRLFGPASSRLLSEKPEEGLAMIDASESEAQEKRNPHAN